MKNVQQIRTGIENLIVMYEAAVCSQSLYKYNSRFLQRLE